MGKAKRMKPSAMATNKPLEQEIQDARFTKAKNRTKFRLKRDDELFIAPSLSRKILSTAREQLREEDFPPISRRGSCTPKLSRPGSCTAKLSRPGSCTAKLPKFDDCDSDEDDEDTLEPDTYYENLEISEEDERALEKFMSKNPAPRRILGDFLAEKLTEVKSHFDEEEGSVKVQKKIDPRLVAFYQKVGEVLTKYRSGKLPKGFKTISNLRNWEEILNITDPPSWSAAAMYQGTRSFASHLTEAMAQRFYNLVLLPRIRDDLAEYKRLNFHLYQSLKKALYKPRAFMRGILIPLLESGNCTLREAIIVGSVVTRNSVPVVEASVAMLVIADMEYTGANSVILRLFFDKKYALPYRVVDGVVTHFLRFERDSREMPVLWHQALLTFVQRYKANISSEQRDGLLQLLTKQTHHVLTPEIRRELEHAKCKDVETAEPKMDCD